MTKKKINSPEQDLIDSFFDIINLPNSGIIIKKELNRACRWANKKYADIEFTTTTEHWVIEAKSNHSSDAPNTIHKIFGELLKETGKDDRVVEKGLEIKYGILIPSFKYYNRGFNRINRDKFIEYGKLIPVTKIFVLENGVLTQYDWADFYDYKKE